MYILIGPSNTILNCPFSNEPILIVVNQGGDQRLKPVGQQLSD